MESVNDYQDQITTFSQQLLEPYQQELDKAKQEIEQLKTTNKELEEKIKPFQALVPLLERGETFHLKLDNETFGLNKVRKLTVLAAELYPILTKHYLAWKGGQGGKRPKDPLRQFILDALTLLSDRPDWIRATFRSGSCSQHRDY
tara:strand:- start:347 stop:781 length:435 start_codon:yes stop_codon:yes gene_type:complete